MTQLQELILRGRFVFSGASKRLDVFKFIDGKNTAKSIAKKTGRSLPSVSNDIKKLKDFELITEKTDKTGNILKHQGSTIYQKGSLLRHVPLSYFQDVSKTARIVKKDLPKKKGQGKSSTIHTPSEQEILDISKEGEDQLYEFKEPGIETHKISKEITAFLHTKNGGIIFYGIDDDGVIVGSDMTRQDFDHRLHNSIRNSISSQPNITIKERNVMGSKIILIIIPPWDKKTLYQYTKTEKYYIRKGTNVFALKPEEIKKLSRGEYVV